MTTYKELVELNEGHDWYYEAYLWENEYHVDQYAGLPVYHGTAQFTPVNPTEFITDDEPR